jgi:hypothetical protein
MNSNVYGSGSTGTGLMKVRFDVEIVVAIRHAVRE